MPLKKKGKIWEPSRVRERGILFACPSSMQHATPPRHWERAIDHASSHHGPRTRPPPRTYQPLYIKLHPTPSSKSVVQVLEEGPRVVHVRAAEHDPQAAQRVELRDLRGLLVRRAAGDVHDDLGRAEEGRGAGARVPRLR